jgi:hypothetical protein
MGDEPVAKEFIKLTGRLLQAVKAPTHVAHVGSAVLEPKWLSDVDIFLNGCVQEGRVDVQTAHLEIVRRCDTKEDAEAGESDDMREGLGAVDSLALATTFGDKPGLVPRDGPLGVCLCLVNPHVVDYSASSRQGN